MKIFIITGIYPPDIGGPAQHCYRIKKELEARGHRVSVLTYGEQLSDDEENGVTRISRSSNWLLRQIKAARIIIKAGTKSDIIYINGLDLPVFLASFFLKKPKKIMRIVRDFAWEYGQRNFGLKSSVVDFQYEKKQRLLAVLRKIQVLSAGRMNRIVVPSNYLKKIVSGWGIKEADIQVIKNGYRPPEKVSNVKSWGKKGYTLLTAGRLVSLKRFDLLIKMLSQLPENYNLAIIGEGDQKGYLQNLIAAY
ncbi:MAG: glycosyltransferase family 4 protein, partial [Candidatus Auribacterota bacterium]|nr:glycosyltransferase family 4 protein [Candidatus Auribacterota bacterium]